PGRVLAGQTDDAHGPLDDTGRNILVTGKGNFLLNFSGFHGKGVMTSLEVLVAQDRATDNGQVCIGAYKVVGEYPHKVQQLVKSAAVNLHGNVLGIEHDAVLVIVNIGRVLQAPVGTADFNGHNPVVGPGRMVHPAGVAFVLPTQLALGIGSLGRILGSGDGLGVLLRLAQVDGDVHFPVGAGVLPAHILGNAVAADVIGVAAELVVPVRCLHWRLCVLFPEGSDYFPGHGGYSSHNPGIENIPSGDAVVTQAVGYSIVQDA